MPEWTIGPVCKTGARKGYLGSNPSLGTDMLTGVRLKEKVKPLAKKIQAAAHPHRLAILYLLAHDSMWPRDFVDALGLAESLVAHHLKQLYRNGWVTKSRIGKHVTYQLKSEAFGEVTKLFVDTPLGRQLSALQHPKGK